MLKTFFLLLLAVLSVSGCASPGQGQKAEKGYATVKPVIEALNRYHHDNGKYPHDLKELVPKYLSSIPQEVNEYPIKYAISSNSAYNLSFDYTGPAFSRCNYNPVTSWKCSRTW